MKTFTDNFQPIQVNLRNIKGEEFNIQSKFMSAEDVKDIEMLSKDRKILETDKVYVILEKVFGKDEVFFKQFSMPLLAQVSQYAIEETKKNSQIVAG